MGIYKICRESQNVFFLLFNFEDKIEASNDRPWLQVDIWGLLRWVQIPVQAKSQTNPASNSVLWVILRQLSIMLRCMPLKTRTINFSQIYPPLRERWVGGTAIYNKRLNYFCKHDGPGPGHKLGSADGEAENIWFSTKFYKITSALRIDHGPVECLVCHPPEC